MLASESYCIEWMADLTEEVAESNGGQQTRGRLCIDGPTLLAEAGKHAVTNRLNRRCCKDGDWEKVHTDEQRAAWLESAAASRELTRLGVPVEVQEATTEECQRVLHVRQQPHLPTIQSM